MAVISVYDLSEVSVNIFGIEITGGYGEGGSIKITRNGELFDFVSGRSGEGVRAKNNDHSATVELTFLQTSEINGRLKAIQALDEAAPNGAGIGTLIIRDRTNGDEYFSDNAWINNLPEVEFARAPTDRTWQIKCAKLEHHPGGRSPVSLSLSIGLGISF